MRNIDSQLLKHQIEAIMAQEREILLCGGIGTGKSYTIAQWILSRLARCPKATFLLCANTYQQLHQATVKAFTQSLDDYFIPYRATLSGSKKRIEIGKATVMLYSLEKYDNIRGVEADYICVDEALYAKHEAIQVLRGRLRGKNTKHHQMLFCSSPNGFNWGYEQFANTTISNGKKLIQAKTKDNVFLPEGYYNDLIEQYGGEQSPLAQQELFGKFVNLQSGAIYNLFDRANNVKPCQLNKQYPVYVGVDFNVEQMNATLVQYVNGVFYCCKEIKLTHRDANTFDLGAKLIQELQGFNAYIVPDSTGCARKTSATSSQSDIQILKNLGIRVMDTQNPFVRDRQNTLNVAFLKKQCFIDVNCLDTIKEIETLSARDQEGKVSHLSVTLGYVLWKLNPLKTHYQQLQPRVIR